MQSTSVNYIHTGGYDFFFLLEIANLIHYVSRKEISFLIKVIK